MRDVSTSFDMTKLNKLALIFLFGLASANAQESPTPTTTPTASATASATAAPTPTATAPRSVRISFVPPPLEGTISLGIYDREGKLVRVLVDQGAVDEFDVGADALNAKWDGKNDHDEDLPAGKYHARGYMVGALKVEDLGPAQSPPPELKEDAHVQVKLVANPLTKPAKVIVDLALSLGEDGIVLKTTDGLPLFNIIEAPEAVRVGLTKNGEKALDVFADNGSTIEQVRVSNVDQMMAFDCGEIELK
jgi:hypothetical protein